MIWRIWIVLVVVVVAGAWVWMVPLSPPPTTETISTVDAYRAMGLLPKAGALIVSEEVGHEVFEVPPGDAAERDRIMAALGQTPAEENAGDDGHAEEENHAEEEDHEISLDGDEEAAHAEDEDHEIKLDDDEETAESVAMAEPAHAPNGHGAGSVAAGLTILAEGSTAEVAPLLGRINIDRTIEVEMREWGYTPDHVMVEPGEVIRLKVSNVGALPHEFMLMDGVGMQAVGYRIDRADWNLLEHRAIYEVPIVMPGRSFEMVAEIHKSGMWMYMCMFPYHMEQGMMGMFMTAGVSMGDMGDHAPPAAAVEGGIAGIGVVVSVTPADGRVVLDHEAIEGYMGAMEMSYMVTPAALLDGLKAGDKVRFTIDPDKRAIVDVVTIGE